MGEMIAITADDGFSFSAYQALPETTPKGSVLIIQEIFGVNQHIREVCDDYAQRGFAAIAPALFDRLGSNITLPYNDDGIAKGRDLAIKQLKLEDAIQDLSATAKVLTQHGKPAVIGYCFGGFLAYQAALEIPNLRCAVAYYGARIANHLHKKPQAPVLFHFSDCDPGIPLSDVEEIKKQLSDLPVYVYPGKHGFNCNLRDSWHEESAALALERTLEFIGSK